MANLIAKKWIGANQVDGTKILLSNNEALRSKDASGASKELIKLDGADKVFVFKSSGAEEIAYKSQVDAEKARAEAAEAALQTSFTTALNNEIQRATTVETGLASDIVNATANANTYTDQVVNTEKLRAQAAEAQALVDAKAYTDAKKLLTDADITALNTRVDNVLSNVDGVALNSLAEIVTAFQQADSDLNGAITTLSNAAGSGLSQEILDRQAADSALQAELDATQVDLASEVTRATNAENAISSTVSTLSTTVTNNYNNLNTRVGTWETYKSQIDALVKIAQKITITQTNINNGYVDLAHLVSPLSSLLVFAERLAMHPGSSEDFTTSTVGGVTRITFVNDFASTGALAFAVGDTIYARYSY